MATNIDSIILRVQQSIADVRPPRGNFQQTMFEFEQCEGFLIDALRHTDDAGSVGLLLEMLAELSIVFRLKLSEFEND